MSAADDREFQCVVEDLLALMWRDLCDDFRQRPGKPIRLDDELGQRLMMRWRGMLHSAARYGAVYRAATGGIPPDHDWTEDAITLPMFRARDGD